jgi:hypothetical protein
MTTEIRASVRSAPGTDAQDSRLDDLVATLSRARSRETARALIYGALASLTLALGLFVLLQLLYWLLGGLSPILSFEWLSVPAWMADWGPAPLAQHIVVAVAGGIAALAVSFVTVLSRPSPIGRMARAADRAFAAEERFSTALELARSNNRRIGVVGEALLRDAAKRAYDVDARKLTPIRFGWQILALPVLAVIAAVIIASPPSPIAPAGSGTTGARTGAPVPSTDFTTDERLDAAGDIRSIAAILAQDGQARSDPVLQAVANELNALGNTLGADVGMTRGEVGDALERLAMAAADAYAAAGVGAEENANYAQFVDDALRAIDPGRYVVDNDAGERVEAEAENAFDFGTVAGANVPSDGEALVLPEGPPANAEAMEAVEGANVPRELQREWDNPYNDDYGDDFAVNPEVEVIGLGEGVGGNMAGLGAAELGGVPGAPIAPGVTEGELLLVDPDPGNGRMIQLDLPPFAELMAVDTEGLEIGLWRALQEQQVDRGAVPAADLEAVGRYFQALMAERAE